MYAIVEIQGQQFKAEAGKYLYVHYLGENAKEGESVTFDKVLLVDADGAVKVGAPTVEGGRCGYEPHVQFADVGQRQGICRAEGHKGNREAGA